MSKMSRAQLAALGEEHRTERQKRILNGVAAWAAYYRENPHRFAKEFLHLELHLFQKILLVLMNISSIFVFVACRGIGKTFISAIFCCIRCILYPGTQVCIASGTRAQSNNVLEKIINELKPISPELAYEIEDRETRITGNSAQIKFKNGSIIKVVTASDGSRGNRAHVLLIDEFRLVKKDTIDTILKKFLSNPRRPKYMSLPEYRGRRDLVEPLKTMYLSSAYYKDHWSYMKARDTCKFMLSDKRRDFVCGFPYQLALVEGLITEDRIIEDMTETDFSEIKWGMEMEALFWGDSEGAFFNYESIAKNRRIEYPMLPDSISIKLSDNPNVKIEPKKIGEKRILSADIALMASGRHQNDASATFINQMLPTKVGRYSNNIVYTETSEGEHTEDQALRIRKLYEEYDCDYIVLDVKGVGLGVYDVLARDITDPESGEVYPALSCYNNPDMAARCIDKNAKKAIWAINATAKFNSDCALSLREAFRSGKIRLLNTEYDGEASLGELRGFNSLTAYDKAVLTMPYVETTLLINELINLQHDESGGLVKLFEKSGMRKDRYSSLAYNYYVSCQVEKDNRKRSKGEVDDDFFLFRAPKTKK